MNSREGRGKEWEQADGYHTLGEGTDRAVEQLHIGSVEEYA